MHYLPELSSPANPDLNFRVSKLSINSAQGVQMTSWAHKWPSPCMAVYIDIMLYFIRKIHVYGCNL